MQNDLQPNHTATYARLPSAVLLSLLLTFSLEALGRRSGIAALEFVLRHPDYFVCNLLIVLSTVSFTMFFRRRIFVFTLISTIWLGCGIANYVILLCRNSPLSGIDFQLIRFALAISDKYISWYLIVLMALAVIAIVALMVFLYLRDRKLRPFRIFPSATVVVTMVILAILLPEFSIHAHAEPGEFADMKGSYEKYGFAFCFTSTIVDSGIDKPEKYSESELQQIARKINSSSHVNSAKPNIIIIQLESFIDPKLINGVTFNEDPIPNITKLKNENPSGWLSVPGIGGGTANTEFEVLTGFSLDYFGPGEYPYQTILRDQPCESIAYVLKEIGYSTHAMHNHDGSFYDRDTIYPMLGFDTFTAAEDMEGIEYTPEGWEKDKILEKYILEAMKSTENRDFVFAVSVQGHGGYPDDFEVDDISETNGVPFDEDAFSQFGYYVSQISEMDAFIGDLVDDLSDYDEPVLLAVYGDHLPALNLTEDMYHAPSIFNTEFFIWNNYGAKLSTWGDTLAAYQLSANLLEDAGIYEGMVSGFHRNFHRESDYQNLLEQLEYDTLYGDMIVYGGQSPFRKTEIVKGDFEQSAR